MSYLLLPKEDNFFNTKSILNSSISKQSLSTTVIDITGSEITYTPHINATKVLYECIFQTYHDPDPSNGINIELFEDGAGKGNNYSIMETEVYTYYQTIRHVKFLIPSYSGSKTFKIRARTNGTGNEQSVHQNADGEFFYPIVMMTSIL